MTRKQRYLTTESQVYLIDITQAKHYVAEATIHTVSKAILRHAMADILCWRNVEEVTVRQVGKGETELFGIRSDVVGTFPEPIPNWPDDATAVLALYPGRWWYEIKRCGFAYFTLIMIDPTAPMGDEMFRMADRELARLLCRAWMKRMAEDED